MFKTLILSLALSAASYGSILTLTDTYVNGKPGAVMANLDGQDLYANCVSFNLTTNVPATLTGTLSAIDTAVEAAQAHLFQQMLGATSQTDVTRFAFAIWELGYAPTPDWSGSTAVAADALGYANQLADFSEFSGFSIFVNSDKAGQDFIVGTPEPGTLGMLAGGLLLVMIGRRRQ